MFLSVVIPCYNEGEVLEYSVCKIVSAIKEYYKKEDFEIILVIEKSTDNTLKIAEELQEMYKFIKVLKNDNKYGKGYSVKKGILYSLGKFILVIDADVPINLKKYIRIMFNLIEDSKIIAVYATDIWDKMDRKKRKLSRVIASVTLFILRRIILNQKISDSQLGCKLYRGEIIKHLVQKVEVNNFLYEIYLTDLIFSSGYGIDECAVKIDKFSEKSSIKFIDIISCFFCFIKYAFFERTKILKENKIERINFQGECKN